METVKYEDVPEVRPEDRARVITVRRLPDNILRGYRLLSAERTKSANGIYIPINDLMVEALEAFITRPEIMQEVQRGGYFKAGV